MSCISPVSIKNPQGYGRLDVPCGKCIFCLNRRRQEWIYKLEKELQVSKGAHFITITYDDDNLPINENGEATLKKSDLQKFHKSLYKENRKYKPRRSMRYYSTGEYGTTTHRPHYHIIAFNLYHQSIMAIERIWPYGFVKVGTVTADSIAYVTKYLINESEIDYTDRVKPFATMSKRPAIGTQILDKIRKRHKTSQIDYVIRNGSKVRMPRIYRDRIFNRFEKDKLNIQKNQIREEVHEKNVEKLNKLGYSDPEAELESRKEHYRKFLLKNSEKNRKL